MPNENIGCAVDAEQPCYVEEDDGHVGAIGFVSWIFNREKDDRLLADYAAQIAIHLGSPAIREEAEVVV